jgi:hypothetical protein
MRLSGQCPFILEVRKCLTKILNLMILCGKRIQKYRGTVDVPMTRGQVRSLRMMKKTLNPLMKMPRRNKIELIRFGSDDHTTPAKMSYKSGDFSFVEDATTREMIDDAYKAIDAVSGGWEFMERDPGDGGFMFSGDPYSTAIQKNMKYNGHSGASYGWTMRVMQRIARVGWERFVAEFKPQT